MASECSIRKLLEFDLTGSSFIYLAFLDDRMIVLAIELGLKSPPLNFNYHIAFLDIHPQISDLLNRVLVPK